MSEIGLFVITLAVTFSLGNFGNENVAGGFGDLEISPTLLTRVDYGNVHLPIWEHMRNSELQPLQRQYFTLPLAAIRPGSSTCAHSVLNDAIIVYVNVLMWSKKAEAVILSQLRNVTKIGSLAKNQLSIIPMERIRVVWKSNLVALSDRYLLDNAWQSYALKTKTITIAIHADTMDSCEKLRDNIKMEPKALNSLELQFILRAKKSFRARLRVKGEHFLKSPVIARMRSIMKSDGTIIMQSGDIARLSNEAVTNVVAERETDAGYIDSGDKLSLQSILSNALKAQPVNSDKISAQDWSSVFWQSQRSRPDLQTQALNKVFQQSKTNPDTISINVTGYKLMMNGLSSELLFNGHSTEATRLIAWLLENKLPCKWTGTRFVISSDKLYRININNLISRKEIISTDVQVHSNERIYSIKPVIPDTSINKTTPDGTSKSAVIYKINDVERRLRDELGKGFEQMKATLSGYRNTMQTRADRLNNTLQALSDDVSDPLRKLRENDRMAQAICSTMPGGRWIFAVRRICPSRTDCNAVCTKQAFVNRDPQTRKQKRGCVGGFHIYPIFNDIPRNSPDLVNGNIGAYKLLKYGCTHLSCGPNYCCCSAG